MSRSKIPDDKIGNLGEELRTHLSAADPVEPSRIEGCLKLLSLVDERVDHAHGILPVDVVIGRPVNLQQPARKVFGMLERSALRVPVLILLWSQHVPLG